MTDSRPDPQLFSTLDHIPIGAFLVLPDLTIGYWNRVLEDWTGIGRDEIVGTHLEELLPHLLEPRYMSRIEMIFDGGAPVVFSAQLHHSIVPAFLPGGEDRKQQTTVTAFELPGDNRRAALFSVQDLTETMNRAARYRELRDTALTEIEDRRLAEKETAQLFEMVRQGKEEWEVTLDSVPELVCLLDEEGRVLRTNSTVKTWGLCELADAVGRYPHELFHGFDNHKSPLMKVMATLFRSSRPGQAAEWETFDEQHGKHFHYELHRSVDAPEKKYGKNISVLVVHDVTTEKEIEQQLDAKQNELQRAQRLDALGKLAGGVAHDFNNLLTAILGYSDFILKTQSPPEAIKTPLKEITTAASKGSDLTKQLLAFSKKQLRQETAVDLNQVIHDIMSMLQRLLGAHIVVDLDLQNDLPPICADSAQMDQVVMNLALNAKKAMPSGGRIHIKTGGVTEPPDSWNGSPDAAPHGFVSLTIADTGIGIPKSVIEHIFEPFFTTSADDGGTGLGLSTVYGIVTQNQGHIEVESMPGEGTQFKMFFPAAENVADSPSGTEWADYLHGSETIVLAEDEDSVRRLTSLVLTEHGYTVFATRDGLEANEAVKEAGGRVDLLLSDVVMPRMTAGSLVRNVRAAWPEIKVLLMSGYPNEELVEDLVRDDSTAFLEKPFKPEALLRKVREVLDA